MLDRTTRRPGDHHTSTVSLPTLIVLAMKQVPAWQGRASLLREETGKPHMEIAKISGR
jgi:hypothetical protein